MEFHVIWKIDLEADSPLEAAELALKMMRDQNSTATVFTVVDSDTKQVTQVDVPPGYW
jgi:hypothetical protein